MSKNVENIGKGRGYVQIIQRLDRITEYDKNPKLCISCNNSLIYDQRKGKFCNHSCAASFNNQGKIKNINGLNGIDYGLKKKNICINCNKETRNAKFCSCVCQAQYRQDLVRKEIEKTGYLPSDVNSRITNSGRKYLIKIRGQQCEKCYNTEWLGKPIKLEIHHEDGDLDNNLITNVLLLCPNCHSYSGSFRNKNIKGNGRWSKRNIKRRQRYSKGLSA